MKRLMLVGVALLGLGLGGCAVYDALTGTVRDEKGNVTGSTGGVAGAVATALGYGWVTTLLGAGTTALAAYKGQGWKAAAKSTFNAIEAWKETPEGKAKWEGLKLKLGASHAEAHVIQLVEKALGNT